MFNRIHAAVAALALCFTIGACGGTPDEAQLSRGASATEQRPVDVPLTKCTTYYYDAPNGNIVGMCTTACSGGASCWGIKTSIHDQDCESCKPMLPPRGP